jgi:hypothetical protein
MKYYIKKIIYKIFNKFYVWYLIFLKKEKVVSLGFWVKTRKVFASFDFVKDPLFNKRKDEVCRGVDVYFLPSNALQPTDVIGAWTMSKEVMGFILIMLLIEKPKAIIECGSGLSTILLAHYASIVAAEGIGVSIVSLEQDDLEVDKNKERLRDLNLDKYADIVHVPIDADGNYIIDNDRISAVIGNRHADWLIIDGPAGPDGCRVSTLPLLSLYCKENARWILDDALRDGELKALTSWSSTRGVRVEGIYPFDKGLGTGRLNCQDGK